MVTSNSHAPPSVEEEQVTALKEPEVATLDLQEEFEVEIDISSIPPETRDSPENSLSNSPVVSEDDFDTEESADSDEVVTEYIEEVVDQVECSEEQSTVLFKNIVDCDWDKALDRVRDNPDEVHIWVKSSGDDSAVLNWSMWRRLPIHEACRRKPPTELIVALLSEHPYSACHTTHFGELPIHLSVGCGASPDVINMLIAANPPGTVATENGGRCPLQILEESGKQREDFHTIKDALKRTVSGIENFVADWEAQMEDLRLSNEQTITKIERDHQCKLSRKDAVIEGLAKQVQHGKAKANDLSNQIDSYENKIASKNAAERQLMDRIRELETETADLRAANRTARSRVVELEGKIEGSEQTIVKLNEKINQLTVDLTGLTSAQDMLVATSLKKAEEDLRSMMESQRMLWKDVTSKREAMRALLSDRGINLPPLPHQSAVPSKGGNLDDDRSVTSHRSSRPKPASSASPGKKVVSRTHQRPASSSSIGHSSSFSFRGPVGGPSTPRTNGGQSTPRGGAGGSLKSGHNCGALDTSRAAEAAAVAAAAALNMS